tara:strand:+ start:309 stop:593 length:285 start_codon:yes stop_codon:yes gene_type:complete
MAGENWNMKWLTSFQDSLVEAQHLTRLYKKNGRPTEEQFKEIKLAVHNAKEAVTYWSSDTADWDKVYSEMPLDQTKVEEQKKFIAETSVPLDDE